MTSARIRMAANVLGVAFLVLFLASVSKDLIYVLGHPSMRPTEANDLGALYRSRGGYIVTSATAIAVALAGLIVPALIRESPRSGPVLWTVAAVLFAFAAAWGLNASFWVHGLH